MYRLPTESEWRVAAGWVSGEGFRRFPWGDEYDANRCNTRESGYDDTTPIGLFEPVGDSRAGICDAAGNVWEWTSSLGREGASASLEALPLDELRWIP